MRQPVSPGKCRVKADSEMIKLPCKMELATAPTRRTLNGLPVLIGIIDSVADFFVQAPR